MIAAGDHSIPNNTLAVVVSESTPNYLMGSKMTAITGITSQAQILNMTKMAASLSNRTVHALRAEGWPLVQVTSKPNMSSRIHKIADSEAVDHIRDAGIAIEVHGWYKEKNRWRCKITDVS